MWLFCIPDGGVPFVPPKIESNSAVIWQQLIWRQMCEKVPDRSVPTVYLPCHQPRYRPQWHSSSETSRSWSSPVTFDFLRTWWNPAFNLRKYEKSEEINLRKLYPDIVKSGTPPLRPSRCWWSPALSCSPLPFVFHQRSLPSCLPHRLSLLPSPPAIFPFPDPLYDQHHDDGQSPSSDPFVTLSHFTSHSQLFGQGWK